MVVNGSTMRRWLGALVLLSVSACSNQPAPETVKDEAMRAGRDVASFPHASEDYFHDMDNGVALTPEEIKGRNMWLVWSGGNDRFWTSMTDYTFGAFDLLKIVSSQPDLGYSRDTRWKWFGLVNEPCFDKPTGPDATRFGLWLDLRNKDCGADPFENEAKYPGVAIGARGKDLGDGKKLPVGSFYGWGTGIAGLRLFPNPDFDEKAAKAWDPVKYYTDPNYYNRKDLVRPYRVGMSCGFCHIGPSPIHPPADPEHPTFANLSSSVGAQYMWVDRLFIYDSAKPEAQHNFMYQLTHTYRPGTMDTSLVSTDSINNARTMNAVYSFMARMGMASKIGHERLGGGEIDNKQFNDFIKEGPLTGFYSKADQTVHTPHVLKDGADSVGLLGALNRVYLNIGLFSEEWLLHFNPVAGGKTITPIRIAVAQKNSTYWQATEAGTPDTALFFLKAAQPDHLADAPDGASFQKGDDALLEHGKEVFADTCARCHSSKAPPLTASGIDVAKCEGAAYLDCFKRYWTYTQTDDYKAQMRKIVAAADFLDGNYLSTDARIPATLLRTNVCSPLATNALAGNIWDNFSSQTYKALPSIGAVTLFDPFDGKPFTYAMPAGGRGYTRVPSLISAWSTAPFLLNNSVGDFNGDPSVAGRMKAFDQAIDQMLWPEHRKHDELLGDKVPGMIDRTTQQSNITIPTGYIPESLRPLQSWVHRLIPWLGDDEGGVVLGPIPAGIPVGLLANTKLRAESDDIGDRVTQIAGVGDLLVKMKLDLLTMQKSGSTDAQLRDHFADLAKPLMNLSKCPDFVVNRGHYFGTAQFNKQDGLSADEKAWGHEPELSDDDKRALIAFIKTF
jgi:hypothetical protein